MTRRLGDLSTSQIVLRALIIVGPVVAVLATGPAGHWPPWWMVAAVLALASGFAALPESPVGVVTFLVVLAWWLLALDDGLHTSVLVVAAALVVTHIAAQLASYGPAAMPVDAALTRVWVQRGIVVLLAVPVVWGLARLLRGDPDQPGIWVIGVAATLAATVAAGIVLTTGPAPVERR
ncbi:hypothetical protein ABLE68_15065 [Nocardioides sp. CN2-186]|uniref:hypothetical protein n=1 Tax=Nocardioides tweenelious TaxID=3156607 RepID=UPI0032B33C55